MASAWVVVRLPSAGTLLGDLVRRHERARVTSVPTGWREGKHGAVAEFLALVEGLSDDELARLLLAWNRRYGEPVDVVGDSFALRLPVRLDAIGAAGIADVMRISQGLPAVGAVAEGDWAEQWFSCDGDGEAERVAARVREALRGVPGAQVRIAAPRARDLQSWEVLHFASGTAPPPPLEA